MKLYQNPTKRNHSSLKKTLVALAMPFAASGAHAGIFTVNNTEDGSAGCTLREAVLSANANANLNNGCGGGAAVGLDTIEFAVNNITLANGEIPITDDLLINTSGSNVTIDANSTSRIFNIQDAVVTLNHLTLTGGDGSDGGSPKNFDDGGALYIFQGSLILQNCIVHGNTAATRSGGGIVSRADLLSISNSQIFNNAALSEGGILDLGYSLSITNSQITSNTATYYKSGGIYVTSESATISGSTISGNTSAFKAGGIAFRGSNASIVNSTISNNHATGKALEVFVGGRGGGLYVEDSDLTITNSNINTNSATGSGGGIYSLASTVLVKDSSISGNSAQALGVFNTAIGGGGIYITMRSSSFALSNSHITLQETTVSNNFSGADGGGILIAPEDDNGDASVITVNTTISNNSASGLGGGVRFVNDSSFGGYASTISENVSVLGAGGISAIGSNTELALGNSIVSGNRSDGFVREIGLQGGAVFNPGSAGNVFGQSEFNNIQSFYGVGINANNIFATSNGGNPQALSQIISPLNSNGGPTRTHALPLGSVAIDNGLGALCGIIGTVDQRGPNNRNDGYCDIGSVEYFVGDTCFVVPTANGKLVNFCL